MIRSFNRRTRCAAASRRGSAAAAVCAAPALADRDDASPDREERDAVPLAREDRARLVVPLPRLLVAPLRLLVPLLLLRVVRFVPVERLPVERLAGLRPDEPPELDSAPEPLLLACGMLPPYDGGRAAPYLSRAPLVT
jgi:hypothetical protein